ncbi:MAG: hypothetical protein HRT77_01390 [Halioglobus sp.]|nr:hypothetical protein [Halioglobus sp.]
MAKSYFKKMERYKYLAWYLPLLLVVIVHWGIYSKGLRSDDFLHLYKMANWPFFEIVGAQHGGHLLYSFNIVVWLVQQIFGSASGVFFSLALLLHFISAVLIYRISDIFTQRKILSLFVALLWGMCPLSQSSLVWISVHGQVYATAALLWVFLDTAKYSTHGTFPGSATILRHGILLLIAGTSFGTGLAVGFAFFVVFLWPTWGKQQWRLLLAYLTFSVLLLFLFMASHESQANWNFYNEDIGSVLSSWTHLFGIADVLAKLFLIGSTGLVLGPLFSQDFVPVANIVSTATLFGVLVTFPGFVFCWLCAKRKEKQRLMVLLILTAAAYGVIALARQPLDAVNPNNLTIALGARYHYLSTAFLAIALSVGINAVIDKYPTKHDKTGVFLFSVWLLLSVGPYIYAARPDVSASDKSRENRLNRLVAILEKAANSPPDSNVVIIQNVPFSVGYILPEVLPGLAGFYIAMYPENHFEGKQVIFVEKSIDLVKSVRQQGNTRAARIIKHESEL